MGSLHKVVIDGSNFMCRLIERDYHTYFIDGKASLSGLNARLQHWIRRDVGTHRCIGMDFFYSGKVFGAKNQKLTTEDTKALIERFGREQGVNVKKVDIRGEQEKGIDVAVAACLMESADICETLVLISSDTDYVPALEAMKRKGRYVITAGFSANHPVELINISYIFYDLDEIYFNSLKEEYQ